MARENIAVAVDHKRDARYCALGARPRFFHFSSACWGVSAKSEVSSGGAWGVVNPFRVGTLLMMKATIAIISALVLLFASGCAGVKLSTGGEKVRILEASEVSSCRRVGQITASITDKLGGVIQRGETSIVDELEAIGRNSAAELGADTIVKETAAVSGRQQFVAYRCVNP